VEKIVFIFEINSEIWYILTCRNCSPGNWNRPQIW